MDSVKVPSTVDSVPQKTQNVPKESTDSNKGTPGLDSLTIKEEIQDDLTVSQTTTNVTDATANEVPKEEVSDSNSLNNSRRKRRETRTDNSEISEKRLKPRTSMSNGNEYAMLLTNFPKSWTCHEVHKYVSRMLEGMEVKMEPDIGPNRRGLRVTFVNMNCWFKAQEKLRNIKLGNNVLKVEMKGPMNDKDSDTASQTTEVIPSKEHDIWEKDPQGLYGLKMEYLATLNITPPIGKWVHITNFRCDKSELRDVFELAGSVVVCSVINSPQKYAKVMYSHPLEAVQAVSMLHNRVFYGQKLCVKIDHPSGDLLLPKGLVSVGPGLGDDGESIRDIAREYERFLSGKSTKINASLFEAGNVDAIVIPIKNSGNANNVPEDPPKPPSPKIKPSSSNIPVIRPPQPARTVRPFVPNREPKIRSFQGNPAMFAGPLPRQSMLVGEMRPQVQYPGFLPVHQGGRMPMQFVQSVPGPISAVSMTAQVPAQTWLPQNTLAPQMYRGQDPTTLRITNLPPTTSFPSLCGKLSTLAQVTSLEFTTPGCAVARFASPGEAEKCFLTENYRSIQLS